MNISNGMIKLRDKIIDTRNFEIRRKTADADLEKHYDCFIEHVPDIKEYFSEQDAFDHAVEEAAHDKRPKLIAREPRYPFLWFLRESFRLSYACPEKRKLNDKYFFCAHCIVGQRANADEEKTQDSLDSVLQRELHEKFLKYPGYEGIIEVPNDRTEPETKATTFHESLHYLFARYRGKTGRNFADENDLTGIEKYIAQHLIEERAVELLTDKLLIHDKDALLEARLPFYSGGEFFKALSGTLSAVSAFALLGFSITQPYLLPLALVPGRLRDFALKKYKESKREEIVRPVVYPLFQI